MNAVDYKLHRPQAKQKPARARRRIDSAAAREPIRHYVLPGHEVKREQPLPGERIGDFLKRTGWSRREIVNGKMRWTFRLPTVCVLNGEPLLQREWKRRRIGEADVVAFMSRPLGGSSSNSTKAVLGIVGVIALAAFAPWAGGLIATGLGFASGGMASAIAAGAITIGGTLLLNTLLAPKAGGQNAQDATSSQVDQLYSVSVSGNLARLMQPIAVQYGRVKKLPDFAATTWSEFIGNDQYLNILLARGLGKYHPHQILLDDTVLWDENTGYGEGFTDIEHAFYDPGEQVTLFPSNVQQAVEVSGQQLPDGTGGGGFIGPFVANSSGSQTYALALDLVMPSGCFSINDDGSIGSNSVTISAEARAIDGAGAPTGSYFAILLETFAFSTKNPQRITRKLDVPAGRYEVRIRRTDEPDTGDKIEGGPEGSAANEGFNEIVWAGLRSFIVGPTSFDGVSTLAIRIKANAQLTQSSSKRIGLIETRILPVWSTDSQTFVDTATRNPWWALYDAATNTDYGAGRPPSKVDFQKIFDEAAASTTRGDTFDYSFTAAVPVPEALDTILRPARARHRWSGDVLTAVRDEWQDVGQMLLTDREIVRGSLSVEWILNPEDSADSVIVEYVDESTWNFAEVQFPPDTPLGPVVFISETPSRVRLDGVVNRDRAYKLAAFLYLQAQKRRTSIVLDTEHDGRMLGFGSRVHLQTELPMSWGSGGEVLDRSSNTLTVSPNPTWGSNPHYIRLRDKRGRPFGPVLCSRGADDSKVVLSAEDLADVEDEQGITLEDVLERADGAEPPSFSHGIGEIQDRMCIVLSGRPNGDKVTLQLAVDDIDVYTDDLGTVTPTPSIPPLFDPAAPIILQLYARFRQGVAEPILDASWLPAPGAVYYRAEVSYDDGESWAQIYEGGANRFSVVVDRGGLLLRVQGVGRRVGAFSEVSVSAPTIRIAPGTVTEESINALIRYQITALQNLYSDRLEALETALGRVSNQDFRNYADKQELKREIVSRTGDSLARITQLETTVTDLDLAFASFELEVEAAIGDLSASVTLQAEAIVELDGIVGSSFGVVLDVNGFATGFKLLNAGSGTSSFTIYSDKFQIFLPGFGTKSPFVLGTINGVPTFGLIGTVVLDGQIIARHLTANLIQAIHIDTDTIETRHLTVDSVPLEALIEGAATNAELYTGGATTLSAPGTFATICTSGAYLFPAGCKLLIDIDADWDCGAETTIDPHAQVARAKQTEIQIVLDGSTVLHTRTYVNEVMTSVPGVFDYGIEKKWAAGLKYKFNMPAGTHTISVRARYTANGLGPQGVAPQFQATYMILTELRR